MEQLTNKNVIATLPTTEDMNITSDGGNTHTFESNDSFTFTYTRRGREFVAIATVNNIDKDEPIITGVENGQRYVNKVIRIVVEDANLDKVEVYKNSSKEGEYEQTSEIPEITSEGQYRIVATDKATNSKTVEFTLINQIERFNNKLNELLQEYSNFENTYQTQIGNISELSQTLNNIKQELQTTSSNNEIQFEKVIEQLDNTYKLGNSFIENISETEELINILKAIEIIGQKYKPLIEISEETIEVDIEDIETQINDLQQQLNDNNDLNVQVLDELKNIMLNYYNSLDSSNDYMKKYNLVSTQNIKDYIEKILSKIIDKYLEDNPVGAITYSVPQEQLTKEDVIATLPTKSDMNITSEGGNTHTFETNGSFEFVYLRRGREFRVTATVNNIDKELPIIEGVENNQRYTNVSVTPIVKDEHLSTVKLYLNDSEQPENLEVQNNQASKTISAEGKYKIVATDAVDNEAQVTFTLIDKREDYNRALNKILAKYNDFESTYTSKINAVPNVINELTEIKNSLQATGYDSQNTVYDGGIFDDVIKLLERTYNIGNNLIDYSARINQEDMVDALKALEGIGQAYKELFEVSEESLRVDIGDIETQINNMKDKLEMNTDLDIQALQDLKDLSLKYYDEISNSNNYIKQYNLTSTISIKDYIEKILGKKVDDYVRNNPIGDITYSVTADKITNKDVIATLPMKDNMKILSEGGNTHTFKTNGDFTFVYNRRGNKYEVKAWVNNIDKVAPVIKGIANGRTYTGAVTPKAKDEHIDLSNIKLYFNGVLVNTYKDGDTISDIGEYKLVAIDLAGNKTEVNFEIKEQIKSPGPVDNFTTNVYDIQDADNIIKKINANTRYDNFRKNIQTGLDYDIRRNGDLLAEEDSIATGDVLTIKGTNKKYTLIVTGDINSDGKVNSGDLVRIRRYLLNLKQLSNIEKLAADANLDGKEVGTSDMVRIRKIILNTV